MFVNIIDIFILDDFIQFIVIVLWNFTCSCFVLIVDSDSNSVVAHH